MPWEKMEDVPAAIRGIDPPVTLEQANEIAEIADAIAEKGDVENPWPIAIATWKQAHRVENGRWVLVSAQESAEPAVERSGEAQADSLAGVQPDTPITDLSGFQVRELVRVVVEEVARLYEADKAAAKDQIAERVGALQEAIEKQFGKDALNYFVVDAPQDGVALVFDVKRDEFYEASYTKEGERFVFSDPKSWMVWRLEGEEQEQAEAEEDALTEAEVDGKIFKTEDGELYPASCYLVVEDPAMPSTWHLRVRDADGKLSHRLMGAAWAALTKGYRGNRYEGPQKEEAMEKLKRLYEQEGMPLPGEEEVVEAAAPPVPAEEIVYLAERGEPCDLVSPTSVVEVLGETGDGENRRGPISIIIEPIQPGWGNRRDRHYYPPELLRERAKVFEGARMFMTDHKAGERSFGTFASVVKRHVGFSESGAPRYEALVLRPDVAEMVRNCRDAGALNELHFSIFAKGSHRRAKVDGQDGYVVTEIADDPKPFIDWVSVAGAGGRAVAVASEAEPPPTLERAAVERILRENGASEAVVARLAEASYGSPDAVCAAYEREMEYLKRATGSGRPRLGQASKRPAGGRLTDEEYEQRLRQLERKFGLTPSRVVRLAEDNVGGK